MTTEATKANITSPDFNEQRLAQLKQLFPDLFDGEGNLDEQALKTIVNDKEEAGAKHFTLNWAGKFESKKLAFTPSKATLTADTQRSIDFDNTENLIIEGDNLEVLKLLQSTYFEQVKCIYIDPPYNTGNDFIYPDKYGEGTKPYWQKNGTIKDGVKLVANSEASGRRHSNWLNMMQSRLLLARQLLRDDGVIFISIDDNEVHNLRKLCDEIFGEENFVSVFTIRSNPRGSQASKLIAIEHEAILVYCKNYNNLKIVGYEKSIDETEDYSLQDEVGNYRLLGLRQRGGAWRREDRPLMYYPIFVNPKSGSVSLYADSEHTKEVLPKRPSGEEGRWTWGKEKFEKDNHLLVGKNVSRKGESDFWDIFRKDYLISEDGGIARKKPRSIWSEKELNYQNARNEIKELFSNSEIFDFPKPSYLINKCLGMLQNDNDIVLDFFAGSGTTAHAVMEQNAKDGGNRRYILVQIPEYTDEKSEAYKAGYKTISDICIERVKRASAKIKQDNPDSNIDGGYRVYKLTDSNFPENLFRFSTENTPEQNVQSFHDYMANFKAQGNLFPDENLPNIITEIALKNGYGLFYTLERLEDKFPDNNVHLLSGNNKSCLLCLDANVQESTVEIIINNHVENQLIIRSDGLDTTKTWQLQNALGDNLKVI